LEIAQNLLKSGMEIEMISKVTGLSKTEIEGV
jgi:predicted transposase YdaD